MMFTFAPWIISSVFHIVDFSVIKLSAWPFKRFRLACPYIIYYILKIDRGLYGYMFAWVYK